MTTTVRSQNPASQEYIERLLAGFPPLTDDQLRRVAALLRPSEVSCK